MARDRSSRTATASSSPRSILAAATLAAPRSLARLASSGWRALFSHTTPAPGERPGAMRIPADSPRPRITAMRYDADDVTETAIESVDDLASWCDAPGVRWIDVQGLGDEDVLRRIGEVFGIHPLAIADVANVPQRPKVEDHGDRHLIVTRMANLREDEVELEQVSLVIGPGWVLTFQERVGDVFEPVRRRIGAAVGVIRAMGPDYLAYALLDAIVDGYFPVVERIGERIDELEEEAIERPSRATLQAIHGVRRELLLLHRIQWRQRDAVNALVRDGSMLFTPQVRPYLRDVYDHAVQVLDVIETFRELAVGLLELHLSTVSNRMNEVMKTLTVMATIFIPLTFVAGVYGMNFEYMPELRWRWGYFGVWGVMLAIALALVAWFRARGWLSDPEDPPD
jgi:magnesium transporter